jgi:hypothetical protein
MVGDYKMLVEKIKLHEIIHVPFICILLSKKDEIDK